MNRSNGSRVLARLAMYALVALAMAFMTAPPTRAAPPLEVTKVVTQVNDAAPPLGEVVAVAAGDTVGYAIAVSGNPSFGGTDVTVTDVFNASVLVFETASVGGCAAQAGQVTCTVRLDDVGDAEVQLTFRVLDVGDCRQLVNRVEVSAERDATGTAQAAIEACPAAGGVLAGTPSANTAVVTDPFRRPTLMTVLGLVALAAGCLGALGVRQLRPLRSRTSKRTE